MPNPGPHIGGVPNSEGAIIVAGGNAVYTFATLPPATNFLPGFLAMTSDQGLCVVSPNHTWQVVGGGVGISAGTNVLTAGTAIFSNSNGVSFGMNTAGVITATVTPGAAAGIGAVQLPNTTYTSGTVNFINSNGISFGSTTGGGVTASYNSTQFAGNGTTFAGTNVSGSMTLNSAGLNLALSGPNESGIGLSAAGSSQTAGNIVFSNSNGVSFGMNGSTVTASVAAGGGGGINASLGGNTSGALALVSTGTLFLAGGNNITLSQNGNSVTVSGANAGGAQTGISGLQVSNTTYTSGTVTFQNANGISFGSSGANGISASYTVPSTAGLLSAINLSAGTTSGNLSAVTFSNANGVSFGLNASTVTASVAAQSSQTEAIFIAGNSTAQSSQSTYTVGSLNISGAGVVSVGWSSNSLIISSPATTGLTLLSAGMSTGGNTAGTTGLASNQLVLAGGNNITLSGSTNAGSMTISIAGGAGAGGVGFGVSTAGNTAGSTGTVTTGNVVLVGSGPISLSQSTGAAGSAATITINAPATSSISATGFVSLSVNGSTISIGANALTAYAVSNTTLSTTGTVNGTALSFAGAGNASVGVSNGSVVVSVPVSSQLSLAQAIPWDVTTLTQIGQGSVQVYPAVNPQPFSASRADVMVWNSMSSSSNSSHAGAISINVGLYTRNGSTLSLATSGSQSYAWTDTSGGSFSLISGLRQLSVPVNVNFPGGDVWAAVMSQTGSTNANWFTAQNVVAQGQATQFNGVMGSASSATLQLSPGMGVFSTTSAALPSSMAFSQITGLGQSSTGANAYMSPVQFRNF